MSGKHHRLARFRYSNSRLGLIVPIDHGLTIGPVAGLGSVDEIASWLDHPAITGVIGHKGMIARLAERGLLARLGVMVHLNGMSALSASADRKERLTEVETAVRLGADGVSLQVNFDGSNDDHNLALLGEVVDEASRFALPVLAMVYDKVTAETAGVRTARLRHLMRIAWELGVDAVKIAAPAELGAIDPLMRGLAEDLPIFFAGGEVTSHDRTAALAREAIRCGAAGLCAGRNVFGQPDPAEALDRLGAVLGAPVRRVISHAPWLAPIGAAESWRMGTPMALPAGRGSVPEGSIGAAESWAEGTPTELPAVRRFTLGRSIDGGGHAATGMGFIERVLRASVG
jgi:class I fructose-bisphosphate aldolase